MNLEYMKVSLFEISYNKKKNFHDIQIFWDAPVLYCFRRPVCAATFTTPNQKKLGQYGKRK